MRALISNGLTQTLPQKFFIQDLCLGMKGPKKVG